MKFLLSSPIFELGPRHQSQQTANYRISLISSLLVTRPHRGFKRSHFLTNVSPTSCSIMGVLKKLKKSVSRKSKKMEETKEEAAPIKEEATTEPAPAEEPKEEPPAPMTAEEKEEVAPAEEPASDEPMEVELKEEDLKDAETVETSTSMSAQEAGYNCCGISCS